MSALLFSLFSQPAWLQFLLLALFGLVCVAVSLLAMHALRSFYPRLDQATPVPTFIGSIATAWALALGFAAADVWTARNHADQAVSQERSTIQRLIGMAEPQSLNIPAMMEALRAYEHAVMEQEWGAGANRQPVADVDHALQQIRLSIVRLANEGLASALVAKMTGDFDELQDARNTRLALGASTVSLYKWYLVLFLTLLSSVAIASVHTDRPHAAYNALGIFLLAAIVSLWILALHATPYAGPAAIMFHQLYLAG